MTNVRIKKQPVLVCIVVVYYGIVFAWSLVAFSMIRSGASGTVIPTPDQGANFSGLTYIDFAITFLIAITALLGTVNLIQLKRVALTLFQISLTVNVLYALWTILSTSLVETFDLVWFIGYMFGLVLLGLVLLYVYRLKQRGVLE